MLFPIHIERHAIAKISIPLLKMSIHLPRHVNIAYMFTSLHHLSSSFVSPFLAPKYPRISLGTPHVRTLTGGPAPFKATLNVSNRISQSSPVLIPVEENEEEAAAAAKDIHIPLDKLFIPPGVDASQLQKAKRLQGSNIVLSPYAKGSQIKQAEFIKSSSNVEECPANGFPEFALVGRSNVGKSSLVNALVRRKQLAMTSKKPGWPIHSSKEVVYSRTGKTQLINHFLINDSWYLVDLPGYGYAIAPHAVRTDWNEFTKDYFLNRKTLVSVMLLIDASIPAKQIDIDCATWLGQNKIPMTFVFTKCDKRKKKKGGNKRPLENVNDFQNLIREFFEETPPWIMTSSVTNQGRDEMLLHIAQLRNYWLAH